MAAAFRYSLLTTLSLVALTAPVAAQEQPGSAAAAQASAPANAPEVDAGDEIIITGTRRTDRTLADSPVPVDVISAEALTNTGLTETNKILNSLVPSFNFPQPSIADGTDVLRPATLRGLSPDQTLVLVNGKRRHVSACSTSTARSGAAARRST